MRLLNFYKLKSNLLCKNKKDIIINQKNFNPKKEKYENKLYNNIIKRNDFLNEEYYHKNVYFSNPTFNKRIKNFLI